MRIERRLNEHYPPGMRIVGRRFRSLEDIYAAVPEAHCQGLCTDYCGPVGGSRQEIRRARDAGVDLMTPTRGIFQLGTVGLPLIPKCPALVDGRCSIYGLRPLICRVWGVSSELPCEYGCQPDRILTKRETSWLLAESVRLGGKVIVGPGMSGSSAFDL